MKALIVIAAIVTVLALVIALQPAEFSVTRTATISAPASVVFAQVNDFHNWAAWSPWAKLDPGMKQAYSGAPSGPGAVYTWEGNHQVGEGRMTVVESRPGDLVRIKLEFVKPIPATNTAEFRFEPRGDQTEVTWTMTGKNNFVGKAISLFMDMDKMVGGSFEQGLAEIKSIAETASRS
jgi:hypothetical protein